MKKSPKCKISLFMDSDNFCHKCGNELKKIKIKICECGKTIYGKTQNFCSGCGKNRKLTLCHLGGEYAIAVSDPKDKEIMIKIISNLLG